MLSFLLLPQCCFYLSLIPHLTTVYPCLHIVCSIITKPDSMGFNVSWIYLLATIKMIISIYQYIHLFSVLSQGEADVFLLDKCPSIPAILHLNPLLLVPKLTNFKIVQVNRDKLYRYCKTLKITSICAVFSF